MPVPVLPPLHLPTPRSPPLPSKAAGAAAAAAARAPRSTGHGRRTSRMTSSTRRYVRVGAVVLRNVDVFHRRLAHRCVLVLVCRFLCSSVCVCVCVLERWYGPTLPVGETLDVRFRKAVGERSGNHDPIPSRVAFFSLRTVSTAAFAPFWILFAVSPGQLCTIDPGVHAAPPPTLSRLLLRPFPRNRSPTASRPTSGCSPGARTPRPRPTCTTSPSSACRTPPGPGVPALTPCSPTW